MTTSELISAVDGLPRLPLLGWPTPLEEYPLLATMLGVESFWVKRDDLTGLAFGGNKVRELEMFLGDAVEKGCDVFVAGGGVAQSNHARQCAAAARRAGMEVHLVLRRGLRGNTRNGNLLVTELFKPTIHWVDNDPTLQDRDLLSNEMDRVAESLRGQGRVPYVLHSSFHPLGAVGYVRAAIELLDQMDSNDVEQFTVFTTSMGATRIGLELTSAMTDKRFGTVSAGWRPVDRDLPTRLVDLARRTAAILDVRWEPKESDFPTIDSGGPDYGIPSAEGLAVLRAVARTTGLLLDPVYSAKGFAGMLSHIRHEGAPTGPVVFLHTGGLPALFAYETDLFDTKEYDI